VRLVSRSIVTVTFSYLESFISVLPDSLARPDRAAPSHLSHRPIPSRIREALRAFAQPIDPLFIGIPSQLTPTRLYSSVIQSCDLGGHEHEIECALESNETPRNSLSSLVDNTWKRVLEKFGL
jgi:hypothetical protein